MQKQLQKLRIKFLQPKDVTEQIRSAMVKSMRNGITTAIDFGEYAPSMDQFCSEELQVQTVFDFNLLREEENYLRLVKEEEKIDLVTREQNGQFYMQDSTHICLLTKVTECKELEHLVKSIPFKSFDFYVITA